MYSFPIVKNCNITLGRGEEDWCVSSVVYRCDWIYHIQRIEKYVQLYLRRSKGINSSHLLKKIINQKRSVEFSVQYKQNWLRRQNI